MAFLLTAVPGIFSQEAADFGSLPTSLPRSNLSDVQLDPLPLTRSPDHAVTPVTPFVPDPRTPVRRGDRLRVRWWGIGGGMRDLTVLRDDSLLVPELRSIPVRGISHGQLADSLDRLLRTELRARQVMVEILHLGYPLITLQGAVPRVGPVRMRPRTHLFDVLQTIGLSLEAMVPRLFAGLPEEVMDRSRPSLRRIEIHRAGSTGDTVLVCDVLHSWLTGDQSHNPPLADGDRIVIPLQGPTVVIHRDGHAGGLVERLPNETPRQLVGLLGEGAEAFSPEIKDAQGRILSVDLDAPLPPEAVIVRLNAPAPVIPVPVVWIVGEVPRPGPHALTPEDDLSSLLRKAGLAGVPDEGDQVVVAIRSHGRALMGGDTAIGIRHAATAEVAAADNLRFRMGRGAWSGTPPRLLPGDTLIVQTSMPAVWVTGEVIRPGFVPWQEGDKVEDLVARAGGWGPRAWKTRINVLDRIRGQAVDPRANVPPNAMIIVPERRTIYLDQWIELGATVAGLFLSAVALSVNLSR